MVVTIGLYNHNGMVGSQIFKYLLPRALKGSIKLVILHRPNSNTSTIPDSTNVERRMVDLETPDEALNEQSVKGIQVVISAASNKDRAGKPVLVDALATSKDLITFVPSDYGLVWTDYLPKYPQIGFVKNKVNLDEKAKSLGIKLTNFRAGCLTPWMFTSDHGDFGVNIKENRIVQFGKSMNQRLPITTPAWLGKKIADIITSTPPHKLADSYSLIETWSTGAEIMKAFEKANGRPPKIEHIDEVRFAEKMGKGMSDALAAGIWQKWNDNHWEYDGEMVTSIDEIVRGMV